MESRTKSLPQSGSAIIVVLLVMTLIFAGALSLRKLTLFQADMALARVRAEQQFYLTDGILAYGVLIAHKNFQALMASPDRTEIIEAGTWPLGTDRHRYSGKVCLAMHEKGVLILAQLYEGSSLVKQLQCELIKEGEALHRVSLAHYSD